MDHLFIKEVLKYLQTSKVSRFIKEDAWACTHGNNLLKKENTHLFLWRWNEMNNHNCFRLLKKLRSSKVTTCLNFDRWKRDREREKRKGKERKGKKREGPKWHNGDRRGEVTSKKCGGCLFVEGTGNQSLVIVWNRIKEIPDKILWG